MLSRQLKVVGSIPTWVSAFCFYWLFLPLMEHRAGGLAVLYMYRYMKLFLILDSWLFLPADHMELNAIGTSSFKTEVKLGCARWGIWLLLLLIVFA